MQSYYLCRDRYSRPRKGDAKGNVEGMVGYPYLLRTNVEALLAASYMALMSELAE